MEIQINKDVRNSLKISKVEIIRLSHIFGKVKIIFKKSSGIRTQSGLQIRSQRSNQLRYVVS